MDLRAGQSLYAQAYISPDIARLADYHPGLALVGPGLGDADVPFEVPDGAGVRLLEPTGPPTRFNEEFTGTRDRIWVTSPLPAASDRPLLPGRLRAARRAREAVRHRRAPSSSSA